MGEEGELRVVLRDYVYGQEEVEEDRELRLTIPEVLLVLLSTVGRHGLRAEPQATL